MQSHKANVNQHQGLPYKCWLGQVYTGNKNSRDELQVVHVYAQDYCVRDARTINDKQNTV